jgi:hypothetical protein
MFLEEQEARRCSENSTKFKVPWWMEQRELKKNS